MKALLKPRICLSASSAPEFMNSLAPPRPFERRVDGDSIRRNQLEDACLRLYQIIKAPVSSFSRTFNPTFTSLNTSRSVTEHLVYDFHRDLVPPALLIVSFTKLAIC